MLTGKLIPYVGRVMYPCDADGTPAEPAEVDTTPFETRCLVLAWFGRCVMFPYGHVSWRSLDPNNPRAYAPGNLAERLI